MATLTELDRLNNSGLANATIVHELRNYLGTLDNCLQYIHGHLEKKEKRTHEAIAAAHLAKKMLREVMLVTETVNDIAMGKTLMRRDVRLSPIFSSDLYFSSESTCEYDLSIPEHLSVLSNRIGLVLVINNLVKNAIEGRANAIKIAAKSEDKHVVLTIQDNGVGINRDSNGEIISTKNVYSNSKDAISGIGLHIVRHLCLQLGIDMKYESSVGQGSRIKLLIPMAHRVGGKY